RLSKHENVQQRVENKLSDIKKRIEGLALNYATLSAKLKDTKSNQPQENMYRRYNQNNYKWEKKGGIECRKCGERGHIARNLEVPISNSRIESLTPYEDIDVYSEAENPALYLTNIEEVPTKKEDKEEKEKTIEERIKEITKLQLKPLNYTK
ncbi:3846_t:CDS:2, partial [Gigaspora margarita]